ncbi:MAG TPA: prolyl oligopeptidase family serine peptidase [Candidatus Sulfotelmatobacter sp.]|nr:prolyl oligopeptidase family serine peptidase [Candidatus Sulfotelmatobacter sp.]
MLPMTKRVLVLTLLAVAIFFAVSTSTHAQGLTVKTGTLNDGAAYLIEVPSPWNGTLFLYSHGYVEPGASNPAVDVGDPATRAFMLANGFALAGSSYATTGWAIQQALPDQIAVLDIFDKTFGHPQRTIAWGHSLGGIITAGLIQRYPNRFDAAQPMCGVLSGGVATWNVGLDGAFVFKTLLGLGTPLQLVNITDPTGNFELSEELLALAQSTPQGQARIALGSAIGDTPGWFTPTSPEPAPTDYATQEANQFLWDQQVDFPFVFAFRAELEARAGGNVSWNTGVSYRKQLEHSPFRDEVKALYKAAGLSLDADLDILEDAPRISADPEAVEYLEHNIIFNGQIHIPVLTMHTTGDGLVIVQNESAYKKVVDEAGNGELLRRTFISRAGHCAFTPAETIAAVGTLINRLNTGKWHDVDPADLNAEATALGPDFNIFAVGAAIVPTPPQFVEFEPGRYPRPFDALTGECEFKFFCKEPFALPAFH